jgi:uncharacterized protein YbjT (DUF2867 family)
MKILLFGATGTVGNAVLEMCEAAPVVEEVRAIARRALMNTSAKLRTYVHKDFLDYSTAQEAFRGIDASLFCLGTSVAQVSKEDYRKISYSFPLAAAQTLKEWSPGAAFHYISGRGTSAQSRMEWARVKAQAEQDLMALIEAVCWRPAFIDAKPTGSMPWFYAWFTPLGKLAKPFPGWYVHGHDLGKAMLQATKEGMRRRVIENPEIREIAQRAAW